MNRERKEFVSCLDSAPIVKLEGDKNKASILNYNLPAATTFTVRVFVPVEVHEDEWNEDAKTLPNDSAFVGLVMSPETSTSPSPDDSLRKRVEKIQPLLRYVIEEIQPPYGDPAPYDKSKLNQLDAEIKSMTISYPSMRAFVNFNISADLEAMKSKDHAIRNAARASYNEKKMILHGISDGKLPVFGRTFYGKRKMKKMISPRKKANPQLFVIEELEVATFLGNYGAGRTVKTFSLLPGEKTTISIKTWRTESQTKDLTQNILDSYSEESADEFENQLENELSTSVKTEDATQFAFSAEHSESTSSQSTTNVGGSISFGYGPIGAKADVGYTTTESSASEDRNGIQSNTSSTRANAADAISKAMDKHVNQSNTARKQEVNVESKESSSVEEGKEETITRELQNINYSRVLNYVFRELNQEFITIIYLKDVSFGFTKGIPGDGIATKLNNLDVFLGSKLKDKTSVKRVRNMILENLCAIYDYEGKPHNFIKKETIDIPDFDDNNSGGDGEKRKELSYWCKNTKLFQEWKGKTVNGVILNTASRILPTDSLIVDAVLGQGEALDCYNMRLQNAAAEKADLANLREQIAQEILEGGAAMKERAEAFTKMFNPPAESEDE